MPSVPEEQAQDPRSGLVAWAADEDEWIRWIVAEVLASGATLGEGGLGEALRRLLAEKGLPDETFDPLPSMAEPTTGQDSAQPLTLTALAECAGINALASGQMIAFNPDAGTVRAVSQGFPSYVTPGWHTARMSKRFQVLSLDGGGYRGVFSAAVLAQLEEDLGLSISDHFDLVAGTSTGGVIALGLGAGLTPLEMVEFYTEQGPKIFGGHRRRWAKHVLRAKYPQGPLREALKQVFENRLFGSSRHRLVIPAYDIRNDKTLLFRTDHCDHLNRDWKEKMVDVALATTAAPTYLPVHQLSGRRLADGGVWANNPVVVALVEAVTFLGVELSDLRILSLGTTFEVKERPSKLDRGGLWQWKGDATDVFLRGQALGASNAAMNLVGEEHFMRIDPPRQRTCSTLTGSRRMSCLAEPTTRASIVHPNFKKKFTGHVATHHVSPNI